MQIATSLTTSVAGLVAQTAQGWMIGPDAPHLVRTDMIGQGRMNESEVLRELLVMGAIALPATAAAKEANRSALLLRLYFAHENAHVLVEVAGLRDVLSRCLANQEIKAIEVFQRNADRYSGELVAAWYRPSTDPRVKWIAFR